MTRVAFGKRDRRHNVWQQRIADARIEIDQAAC